MLNMSTALRVTALSAMFAFYSVSATADIVLRDPALLLNQFYALKKNNPTEALQALQLLIKQNPNNVTALKEMGYWLLAHNQPRDALGYFVKADQLHPEPQTALQVAYVLVSLKDTQNARLYFQNVIVFGQQPYASQARKALNSLEIKPALPTNQSVTIKPSPVKVPEAPQVLSKNIQQQPQQLAVKKSPAKKHRAKKLAIKQTPAKEQPLDTFYRLKKTDPVQAKIFLIQLLQHDPNNAVAHAELAYLYFNDKEYTKAYTQFDLAAQYGNKALSLQSNQAMTNMAGLNTRYLPDPFFVDIYAAPLYYGRFNLGILPLILRAGLYIDADHRTELYTYLRYTKDDKSGTGGVSPLIFEDNVAIAGVGLRQKLLATAPLYAYAEIGRAYDLLPMLHRWKDDRRAGFIFYENWGRGAVYQPTLKFPLQLVGNFYADASYYSRYANVIGIARLREGLRIAEYGTSAVDVYLKGQLGQDSQRVYYNNFLEVGPGIAIVPNNRYNIAIRAEILHGFFLPIDGNVTQNPYGKGYNTANAQLELYMRF